LAQNERQRRCKQQQKEVVHNALAIVVESVQENNNVNLERLNTRCAKKICNGMVPSNFT